MNPHCETHLAESLAISHRLMELADSGVLDAEDDSCRVLYGVIRDAAWKIRALAEQEARNHRLRQQ